MPLSGNKMKASGNSLFNTRRYSGFTLVEVTVVIALISVVFFVSLPSFDKNIFMDQTKKLSRWLLVNVRYLKEASFRERKDYILHVDMDDGKFWISYESKPDEEFTQTSESSYTLSGDIRILDVEFAGDRIISDGVADIVFYASGYSDNAIIHIENEDNEEISYMIQPFLLRMKYIEAYAHLED